MAAPRHVDRKVIVVWLFPLITGLALVWLLSSLVYFIAPLEASFFGIPKMIFPITLVLAMLILLAPIVLVAKLTYDNFTYEIGEHEFIVREGVITRKTTVVPYRRIQDISSTRSLVERALGLASIQMETAGATLSRDFTIQGITNKDSFISEVMAHVERIRKEEASNGSKQPVEEQISRIMKELKELSSRIDSLAGKNAARNSTIERPPARREGLSDFKKD